MSLRVQVSWGRSGRLPGRRCLAGRLPVAAYYMYLASLARGLYGAWALIWRPLRGKVSLQRPRSKGPDVDLSSLLLGPCEACAWSVWCPGVDLSVPAWESELAVTHSMGPGVDFSTPAG